MQIIKKENGTENRLAGVKFNLLDENKDIVKEGLVTDENGEIIIEKMIPGKYYINEIETLAGFELYTDLIEVEIGLNKEIQITVNNSTKLEAESDNIDVTPTFTEVVKNVEKTPENPSETVETIVTNKTPARLPVTGC